MCARRGWQSTSNYVNRAQNVSLHMLKIIIIIQDTPDHQWCLSVLFLFLIFEISVHCAPTLLTSICKQLFVLPHNLPLVIQVDGIQQPSQLLIRLNSIQKQWHEEQKMVKNGRQKIALKQNKRFLVVLLHWPKANFWHLVIHGSRLTEIDIGLTPKVCVSLQNFRTQLKIPCCFSSLEIHSSVIQSFTLWQNNKFNNAFYVVIQNDIM